MEKKIDKLDSKMMTPEDIMDRRDLQIYKQEQLITKYEALLSRVVPRLNSNSLAASPVDERPAKRSAEDDKRGDLKRPKR